MHSLISELTYEKAGELLSNSKNWRVHPEKQKQQMAAMLSEIGWAGAIVGYRSTDGQIVIIDGHMRADVADPDDEVPVLLLDCDESTADKVLATFDSVGAGAEVDAELVKQLHDSITFESDSIGKMLLDAVKEKYGQTDIAISELKEHPKRYRRNTSEQLEHLVASIKQNGIYRPIVTASDNTILAGHGVFEAAKQIGFETVPVIKLEVESDSIKAMKILAGDNETKNLTDINDRVLTEVLKEISDKDTLEGTGYDKTMLAGHVLVTRGKDEIPDVNAAAEWVGLPEYDASVNQPQVVITFSDEQQREDAVKSLGIHINRKLGKSWSCIWDRSEIEDVSSVKFEPE